MVVIAADHRDGSAPISFVHTPGQKEEVRRVEYRKVPHKASTEVYEQRDEQLRIRLWELGLIHDAVQKMDKRVALSNVADDHKRNSGLTMFAHKLNVEEPGSISWAGHSFGAATMVQFIKSTYYRGGEEEDEYYAPLFTPEEDSCLVRQITPKSPVVLLDLWTLPIQSPETAWLRKHPMPCYKSEKGGSNLLAILSEAFFKWSSNLEETKRIIAKPSTSEYPDQPGPHLFYPVASAHLSQSDFGLLFPWLTTKVFGAKEPERVLKLNTRAILQVLRNSGVELARTRRKDLESEDRFEVLDETILSKKKDSVRGWISLSTDPDLEVDTKTDKGPGDAVVEGEVLGETVTESER
jgi:platelet-activating factor acetylhydrolase